MKRSMIGPVLRQYVETALWSSVQDDGTPFDRNYTVENLSHETIMQAIADLEKFISLAGHLLDGLHMSSVAHDFWLTRNRHGAGFWDGDYKKSIGDALTEIAHSFRELSPVIGDDGQIYFE